MPSRSAELQSNVKLASSHLHFSGQRPLAFMRPKRPETKAKSVKAFMFQCLPVWRHKTASLTVVLVIRTLLFFHDVFRCPFSSDATHIFWGMLSRHICKMVDLQQGQENVVMIKLLSVFCETYGFRSKSSTVPPSLRMQKIMTNVLALFTIRFASFFHHVPNS